MVEKTAGHPETDDAVAGIAVKARYRVARRLPRCRSGTVGNMTGITGDTRTGNIGTGMVRVGIQKAVRGMTVSAFRAGVRVGATLADGRRLAGCHSTVMATAARPGNARMIEAAVRIQIKKSSGIVAVIAFSFC